MSNADWSTIGVIVAIFVGLVTVYYLNRSWARDNERRINEAQERAVTAACQPLNDTIANLRLDLRTRDARIDSLEDQLRDSRGSGGNRAGR